MEEYVSLKFVPSHHDFDQGGVAVTWEMIATWPIRNSQDKEIDPIVAKIYKDAFNALRHIGSFQVKVSMEVDVKNRCFRLPKRVWSQISLNNETILGISHDSRVDTAAHRSLFDWPEIMNFPSWGTYAGDEKETQKVIDWSSPENWEKFFRDRIKYKAIGEYTDAKDKLNNAQRQIDFFQKLFLALM